MEIVNSNKVMLESLVKELLARKLSNDQTLKENLPIITKSIGSTLAAIYFYNLLKTTNVDEIPRKTIAFAINLIKKLPILSSKYNKEIDNQTADLKKSVPFKLLSEKTDPEKYQQVTKGISVEKSKIISQYLTEVNEHGESSDEILENMKIVQKAYDKVLSDDNTRCGNLQCYYFDKDLMALQCEVYKLFMKTNAVHFDHYLSIRKIEAEVCRMVLSIYKGDNNTAATHTTGGTESIFLAMLSYRNRYYEKYGNWPSCPPEILCAKTVHPAFNRAADYFKMKIVYVKTDENHRMICKDLVKKISSKSVVVVLSCPNYPQGVFDPVHEVSDISVKYNLPIHLDCCLGGFLVPFANQALENMDMRLHNIPECNFSTPGVTTISADIHKYGCSPKGSSCVLFKDSKLRSYSFYSIAKWPGGVYASSTLAGSRSGASAAISWATMRKIGYQGYVDKTQGILQIAKKIHKFVSVNCKSYGLEAYPSELSTVCLYSNKFDIYQFFEHMNKLGWSMQALQEPPAVHICFSDFHVNRAEKIYQDFCNDTMQVLLEISDQDCKELPSSMGFLYGMSTVVKDTDVVENIVKEVLDGYYGTQN